MEIRKIIVGILLLASLMFAGLVMAAQGVVPMPNTSIMSEINQARDLLDSWSGQGEILAKAKYILDRVMARDPQNYHALKEVARYYIMDGYISSVKVSNGRNIYSVGRFEPGTLERAEKVLKTALHINPNYAEGYILLGHVYSQQSRLKESCEALAKAEALGTDDPWLHLNWAYVLIASGEIEKAADRYRIVLRSGTKNKKALISTYSFLIEFHKDRREYEKVSDLFETIFKIDPTNAWARGNYADFLRTELGKFDEAVAYAREALRIMDYGVGRLILAKSLYGKWADLIISDKKPEDQAQEYFDEAFRLYPYLNLVMAYEGSYAKGRALVQLLKSKGVPVDAKAEDGSTALIIASNTGRVDAVLVLLSLGANPNAKSNAGWTPLLGAADEGHREVVEVLLESGADPKQMIRDMDAATLAARRGRADIVSLIRRYADPSKQ
jgi:tetratricopeptide (TPR) repeat protein